LSVLDNEFGSDRNPSGDGQVSDLLIGGRGCAPLPFRPQPAIPPSRSFPPAGLSNESRSFRLVRNLTGGHYRSGGLGDKRGWKKREIMLDFKDVYWVYWGDQMLRTNGIEEKEYHEN
jgi:hypothetical protein